MKHGILVFLAVIGAEPSLCAQGASAISTPAARLAVVAVVDKVNGESAPMAADSITVDPFNPPKANMSPEEETDTASKSSSMSDDQLAVVLAAQIQPTGSMMQGGEPYLMFTERRQKIGDKVAVTFDKVEYIVEIVSIANNRFRIRYKDKEAERTIK
jgi:flagellar biosynthesis component FlhA